MSLAVLSAACSNSVGSGPAPAGEGPVEAGASADGPLPGAPIEASPSEVPDGAGQAAEGNDAVPSDATGAAPEAAAVCDRHFPACPSPPPSYKQAIVPVVMMECLGCHYAGNTVTRNSDYTTYQGVYKDRGSILDQLYSCEMPPSTYPPLTADERTAFLQWLECGAPNN